jgi:cytochrome P450
LVESFSIPIAIQAMCEFDPDGDSGDVRVCRHRPRALAVARRRRRREVALQGAKLSEAEAVEAATSYVELQHYVARELIARQGSPADDLLGAIANAKAPDGLEPLTMAEMVSLAIVAGNETTRSLLGSRLMMLAKKPALVELVRTGSKAMDTFIEEALRAMPPVWALFRITTKDAELSGLPIAAGELVVVAYGSANYDEAMFSSADEFDMDRENVRRHLSFGMGMHFCMEAPLARVETRIALRTLLERFDRIEFDPNRSLTWASMFPNYALKSLPVVLHARVGPGASA